MPKGLFRQDKAAFEENEARRRLVEKERMARRVQEIQEEIASVRGDSAERRAEIITNYPLYPFDALEMPPIGPNFERNARNLCGENPEPGEYAFNVDYLHGRALYDNKFSMSLLLKGKEVIATFIPGHLRGAQQGGNNGPRVQADIMVVGKMPAEREAMAGLNFQGASGEWLLRAINDSGCKTFESWYLTNLVKFPIPVPSMSGALPAAWIKDCAPLLAQELRLVRPKYVLCLGSEASQHFLGADGKISIAASRVFDRSIRVSDSEVHSFKVMSVLHPSMVARQPDVYDQFLEGIRMFVRLTEGQDPTAQEEAYDIRVIRNVDEARAFQQELLVRKPTGLVDLSIDAEWHKEYPFEPGAYVRTIQLGYGPNDAVVFMLHDPTGKPVFEPSPQAGVAVIKDICTSTPDRPVCLITHFGRADLPWIKSLGFDMLPMMLAPPDTPEKAGVERYNEVGHGWDTGLSAHAVNETDDFKLELQVSRYCGMPRWDGDLQQWKRNFCAENQLEAEELEGYGPCPDSILVPYGGKDAIGTWRLKQIHYKKLFSDNNGQDSWVPFWIASRAVAACAEIEDTGMCFDTVQADELRKRYEVKKVELIQNLRDAINWPDFKPASVQQCKELLFGVGYSGAIDKETGEVRRVSPPDAILCNLMPIKSSSKNTKKSWAQLLASGDADKFSPSTDKETLGILAQTSATASQLRNIRFVTQLLNTTLRAPERDKKTNTVLIDEDTGEPLYERGLLAWICADKRIRTHILQILETGRWASRRPNLQNISKRREADYKAILKDDYLAPLRTMFVAPPGHVLIEADYASAELAVMAWMSQDENMLEHVRRNLLPEKHPDYYDIHSNIACRFFQLPCQPTKKGLEEAGFIHLRVAAKNVIFGYAYGRGAEAIARQCKEEAKPGQPEVTVREAQTLIDGLSEMYPGLVEYFAQCKLRPAGFGWLRNCFGRLRRFTTTDDLKIMGELQRQAMNFPKHHGEVKRGELRENLLWQPPGCTTTLSQAREAISWKVQRLGTESLVDSNVPTSAPAVLLTA